MLIIKMHLKKSMFYTWTMTQQATKWWPWLYDWWYEKKDMIVENTSEIKEKYNFINIASNITGQVENIEKENTNGKNVI